MLILIMTLCNGCGNLCLALLASILCTNPCLIPPLQQQQICEDMTIIEDVKTVVVLQGSLVDGTTLIEKNNIIASVTGTDRVPVGIKTQ